MKALMMSKHLHKNRARFTRWYFRAGYELEPEACPRWLRPAARRLLSATLYIFMATRPAMWEAAPKPGRLARMLSRIY